MSVAEMAAEQGLQALSLKAVREALSHGPPHDAIQPELQLQYRSARIDTEAFVASLVTADPVTEIHDSIRRLYDRWQSDNYNDDAIFETLAAVVLPDHAALSVELYVPPATVDPQVPNRIPEVSCVARLLVEHAALADRLDVLLQRALQRSSPEARLLAAMIALQQRDENLLGRQLAAADANLQAGGAYTTAVLAAATATDALQSELAPTQAAALLQHSAELIGRLNAASGATRESPARAFLLAAARALFATGQSQAATKSLAAYLSVEVPSFFSNSRHNGYRTRQQSTVARELYARGLVDDARRLLGGYAQTFERSYGERTLLLAQASAASPLAEVSGTPKSLPRAFPETQIEAGALPQGDLDAAPWLMKHDFETGSSQRLFVLPDFALVAHAAINFDGSELAFAATRPERPAPAQSRLYVLNLRDGSIRDLGPGTQPSWSPRATRLTFSAYTPSRGVWLVRSDGSDRQLLDEQGWGSRWSPDGRMIAFADVTGERSPIIIHDVVEEQFFAVAIGDRNRSSLDASSLQWLPDSLRLSCWLTTRTASDDTASLVTVPVFGSGDVKIHASDQPVSTVADVSWHPDAGRATFTSAPGDGLRQLFTIAGHPDTAEPDAEPVLLVGQPPERRNSSATITRDGAALFYISRP